MLYSWEIILKVYGSIPEYLHDNGGYLTDVWFDDMEIWNSLPASTKLRQLLSISKKETRFTQVNHPYSIIDLLGREITDGLDPNKGGVSTGIRLVKPERSSKSWSPMIIHTGLSIEKD